MLHHLLFNQDKWVAHVRSEYDVHGSTTQIMHFLNRDAKPSPEFPT